MSATLAKTRDILSPRQRQILDLLARGESGGQAARTLGLKSVDGALSVIYLKIGVRTREAAIAWAKAHGLGSGA